MIKEQIMRVDPFRCGMRSHGNGVNCEIVEWVKRSTVRWFGLIERMGNEEFCEESIYE